jgi:hypothetical protein
MEAEMTPISLSRVGRVAEMNLGRKAIAVSCVAVLCLAFGLSIAFGSGTHTRFAGSYTFSFKFYNHGALVSSGTQNIGFGTDGRWTMTKCSETGTYSYDEETDTLTFKDKTDAAHGEPVYTWVGSPTTGFVGTMKSTAAGLTTERGNAIATPKAPGSCE